MIGAIDKYFDTARKHEAVFRNVLRDLKNNRNQRPMGIYVPEDLETEADLEVIFEKYSHGVRYGRFTITNFQVDLIQKTIIIEFSDVACLSGGGAGLRYLIKGDSVEYQEPEYIMMS